MTILPSIATIPAPLNTSAAFCSPSRLSGRKGTPQGTVAFHRTARRTAHQSQVQDEDPAAALGITDKLNNRSAGVSVDLYVLARDYSGSRWSARCSNLLSFTNRSCWRHARRWLSGLMAENSNPAGRGLGFSDPAVREPILCKLQTMSHDYANPVPLGRFRHTATSEYD